MKNFSTRETARILEATETQVRTYARLGRIVPQRGPGRRLEFSFQDLLLLKATKGLLDSGVPARRMRRIWESLREQLDADTPLTSVKVLADGDRAVALDGDARWQPDSGQFLLDLDVGGLAQRAGIEAATDADDSEGESEGGRIVRLTPIDRRPAAERDVTALARRRTPTSSPASESSRSAEEWFHLGCDLESTSPLEARAAYVRALEMDPGCADAHLNLGRLDHEAGELGKAEVHYRDAVRCAPEDSTAHFNLGVLLEDRGRPEEAIYAYQQAIARDPESADAHYNLGLLLESLGRRSGAMRHLMAARQLYEGTAP